MSSISIALKRALPKQLQRQGNILRYAMNARAIATRALGTAVASSVGQVTKNRMRSGILSLSLPESDFMVQTDIAIAERAFSSAPRNKKLGGPVWSGNLSFASPESDFSAEDARERAHRIAEQYRPENFINLLQNSEYRSTMAYSLSFTSPESDFCSPHILSLLDERQRPQLARSEKKLEPHGEVTVYDTRRELLDERAVRTDHDVEQVEAEPQFHFEEVFVRTDSRPLPQTFTEATQAGDDRAIVVTEANIPFKIVSVNSAWEGLCGYTLEESKGKTLGELLQGPDTDASAATALIDKLLHDMEAGAVLTNYAKGGRKFQNRIRVGTLKDKNNKVTHFVGVLKEITEMGEHFSAKKKNTYMHMA